MCQILMTTFGDWLLVEMEQRGWNKSELARRAKVSPAAITDVISGRRNVGKDLATSIAKALHLPPEQVFREAGFLPAEKELNPEVEQILHEIEDLSPQEQREILSYIRWRNNQRKKQ